VTSWSDVTARMFGVEFGPGEMPFDSFRNRIHPDDLAEFDAAVARSIVTDQPYRVEFRAVWPDGRHRWISSKGRVSRNHEGEPVAITGIALDVSERKDLEQQLLQSIKLEGIGRLAGGIAHDFNNLLTVIQGYAEMVLDQIGPDKPISGDLQEIRDASDRAAALTRQLLAFSRKQTLHIAAMDLNEIIVSLRNMLQRLIGEDIDIRLELTPDLPLIRADRAQVDQVLMNLVVNARDAMPDGGVITLATTAAVISREQARMMNHDRAAPGQYAQLRVTDSGTGMDAATRDRIFEPFFTTKGVGKGTGLGLSTVYGVLQQLGGNIEVASAPGHGTTFTLYFPKAPEGMASTVDVSKHAAALADRREVVLVVEDQRGVRQLVSRILSRHGYTVLEAADSDQALALAEHHSAQIDLVLTDVVMPVMSGPELVAVLRAARPLKVLYMSGYTGADLSRRAALAADDTVLEKPFTASVLLDAVREVLDQREARAH
jgi:two-component system cell cycle sensor histidine kinase/response regulator CckA